MACTDGGAPYPPSRKEVLDHRTPAMLCAILCAIPSDDLSKIIDCVDKEGSGVNPGEILEWWSMHRAEDAKRRLAEQESEERDKLRRAALEKLTPAEREAFGMK